MARLRYSGIAITGGSGRINTPLGGDVLLRNGVVRSYATPTNPNTASQAAVRAIFAGASAAWANITEAARQAYQSATGFSMSNSFYGTTIELMGKRLFTQLYLNCLNADGDAAGLTSGPPTQEMVSTLLLAATTIDASAQTVSVAYTGTVTGSAGTPQLQIFATPPMPATRMVPPQSEMRLIFSGEEDVSPQLISTPYIAKFGALSSAEGKKVFLQAYIVDPTTGQRERAGSAISIVVA